MTEKPQVNVTLPNKAGIYISNKAVDGINGLTNTTNCDCDVLKGVNNILVDVIV